ncbi:MAG: SurA N-terminal domain-containing protein [Bacteriovoracales bacterium]|nr:SurA N-terminal domain-containing protein [Bacteriovoracales bacterium]
MASFRSTTAQIITFLFVGLIVFAFVFTFDAPQTFVGRGQLGRVGPHEIDFREFNRQYEYRQRLFSSQKDSLPFGGGQMDPARLRRLTLRGMINEKLYLILGEKSHLNVGADSIRQEIRKQGSFQTEGQFDFFKYKDILEANRLTPGDYEQIVANDIIKEESGRLVSKVSVSKMFAKEMLSLKRDKRKVSMVRIKDGDVRKRVPVSKGEIDAFLGSEEGKKKALELFEKKKSSLDKKEEVKARHILFKGKDSLSKAKKTLKTMGKKKMDAQSFGALAKKHSEGPTKTKGGDLGWFGRGQMVKEFEEVAFRLKKGEISDPVKSPFGHHLIMVEGRRPFVPAEFKDHERKLALEWLRGEKKKEAQELRKAWAKEFMAQTSKTFWEKRARKYGLAHELGQSLGRLDSALGSLKLSPEEKQNIFKAASKDIFLEESAMASTVIYVHGDQKDKDEEKKTVREEWEAQRRELSFRLRREWMDKLWKDTPVSCGGMKITKPEEIFKCQI